MLGGAQKRRRSAASFALKSTPFAAKLMTVILPAGGKHRGCRALAIDGGRVGAGLQQNLKRVDMPQARRVAAEYYLKDPLRWRRLLQEQLSQRR